MHIDEARGRLVGFLEADPRLRFDEHDRQALRTVLDFFTGRSSSDLLKRGFAYATDHPDEVRMYQERGDFPPALFEP